MVTSRSGQHLSPHPRPGGGLVGIKQEQGAETMEPSPEWPGQIDSTTTCRTLPFSPQTDQVYLQTVQNGESSVLPHPPTFLRNTPELDPPRPSQHK